MAYSLEKSAAKGHPRALARIAGNDMYMPNKPCPKGHLTLRYTKYGQCLDCLKLWKKDGRESGRYKETEKAYTKKYLKENRQTIRLKPYGLTVKQFEQMLVEQNNKCKICGNELQSGKKTHIDHCHKTNAIRGILCHGCNVGLGFFKHNSILLKLAAEYCNV